MYKEVIVRNNHNTETAKQIVNETSRVSSQVYILCDNKKVNAKSIMGVLSLSLRKGDTAFIEANGDDAEIIIEILSKII